MTPFFKNEIVYQENSDNVLEKVNYLKILKFLWLKFSKIFFSMFDT